MKDKVFVGIEGETEECEGLVVAEVIKRGGGVEILGEVIEMIINVVMLMMMNIIRKNSQICRNSNRICRNNNQELIEDGVELIIEERLGEDNFIRKIKL